jgi:hypothetical protein
MIDARIEGDSLEVQATGRDWWPNYNKGMPLSTRLRVRLPLEHITAARTAKPRKRPMYLNGPAGRNGDGEGIFIWCRRGVPVLELDMDGQPYQRVALSVPDPERLAEQIRAAAGVSER